MRINEYIHGIEGVAAGGTAVINVPVNRRHHEIKLLATGKVSLSAQTDLAQLISGVRILVNGVVMWDLTPKEIQDEIKLNGLTINDNELPLYFSCPWRRSVTGEEATSWDLTGQTKCVIEVTFKATVTSPTLKAISQYDFGRNVRMIEGKMVPFNSIIKKLRMTYNVGTTQDITSLPTRFPIHALHLEPSTGTITSVEVTRDGQKVFEALKAENDAILNGHGIDASQIEFPLIFDFDQQASSFLKVRESLNVRVVSSAANTLSVVVHSRSNGYS